jgi:hypothetical protein
VTVSEIVRRLWRHPIAVLVIIFSAVAVLHSIKNAPPTYGETGTMVFLPPYSGVHPNPYTAVGGSLTPTAGVIAAQVMSPRGQQQVAQAGGTASYDIGLVNSYNLQYPDYSNPYLVITTTDTNPDAANKTFTVVTRMLSAEMTASQIANGVPKRDRIFTQLAGDSGPLLEQGSPKRSLAGLIILTIVAVFAATAFLDRHPVRLGRLFGVRTARARVPRAHPAGIQQASRVRPDVARRPDRINPVTPD